MRNISVKLMVCAVVALSTLAKENWELNGADYQSKKASEKASLIWQNVIADKTSTSWLGAVGIAGFLAESMSPTVEWISDTLPTSWLGKRTKNIHTVGTVCQVKFVPVANNEGYTGLFEGADYGFIRFSTGAQADASKKKAAQANGNFAPGFGIKLLVDGQPSANHVTLTATQDSWNFFKNDFSNHIPVPPEPIFSKFGSVTKFPQHVGLSNFAKFKQNGQAVASPKFPFQLIYKPTSTLRTKFSDDYTQDFTDQLQTITKGTTLYSVFAVAEPGKAAVHIGEIITTSEITKSKYGDTTLFFKHQRTDEDVDIRPEWKNALDTGKKTVQESDCPMHKLRAIISGFAEKPSAIALGH